jgi:hypothetical protein
VALTGVLYVEQLERSNFGKELIDFVRRQLASSDTGIGARYPAGGVCNL